jgi:hypothetical protein
MPVEENERPSLAYKRHGADIRDGVVPAKYTRLVPYIKGECALEIGAAEGVLTLLLARERLVTNAIGLELRPDRHHASLRLQQRWNTLGFDTRRAQLVCGDILENFGLLAGVDVLIAVRAIYYMREHAPRVMAAAAAAGVKRIVLCGNRGRQQQHRQEPRSELGRFNFLAAIEGMTALLEGAAYRIETTLDHGDPIVVGVRP